ncbi:hypothetical protein Z043_111437 [Scleropages formosus]|uniref:SAM domain-containing protein n=1 Tax=Scleropages formosus TaxID=113540 RepID=A0A0P7V9E5_SCLFO|nr:hypothetical protein Z043_111437 [Scleropages formosus]
MVQSLGVSPSWKPRTAYGRSTSSCPSAAQLSACPCAQVRPIGYDGNNPTSVAEWLESLELGDYTKAFLVNGYTSMELVKKIWEIELINHWLLLKEHSARLCGCAVQPVSTARRRDPPAQPAQPPPRSRRRQEGVGGVQSARS